MLDTFALLGAVAIKLPRDWTVVTRGLPVLGGFEDRTRSTTTDPRRCLIVRGTAVMGSVEVMN